MFPKNVASLFEEIRKGSPFPFAWLGTGEGRVRTVRVAGFNLQQGRWYVTTHRRHAKVEQIRQFLRGELCLVELSGPLQLRLRSQLGWLGPDREAMRESLWRKVPGQDRWRFYGSEPTLLTPAKDFLVLEGLVEEIDLLDLRPEYPVRRGYLRRGDDWVEEERLV
ncbi:MAG: hypothetical protein AMXMBFR33_22940 [Candidatus Xenobia bacterium]